MVCGRDGRAEAVRGGLHAEASSSLQVWKRPMEKERYKKKGRKRMVADRVAAMRLLTTSSCEYDVKIARTNATEFLERAELQRVPVAGDLCDSPLAQFGLALGRA
jgi:hypothetical protein